MQMLSTCSTINLMHLLKITICDYFIFEDVGLTKYVIPEYLSKLDINTRSNKLYQFANVKPNAVGGNCRWNGIFLIYIYIFP